MLKHVKLVMENPCADLTPAQKSVLMTFAYYASPSGEAYPKTTTVMRATNLSRRAIYTALSALELYQYLTRDTKSAKRRSFVINCNKLTTDEKPNEDTSAAPPEPEEDEEPECTSCTPKVHLLHPKSAYSAPYIKGVIEGGKGKGYSEASSQEQTMKKPTTLAEVKASQGKTTYTPKSLVAKLRQVWIDRVPMEYDIPGMYKFTEKDRGQMRMFANAVGMENAERVLGRVIDDWHGFTGAVKESAGVGATPADPHVGFLLKYSNVAGQFAMEKKTVAVNCNNEKKVVGSQADATEEFDSDAYMKELFGEEND